MPGPAGRTHPGYRPPGGGEQAWRGPQEEGALAVRAGWGRGAWLALAAVPSRPRICWQPRRAGLPSTPRPVCRLRAASWSASHTPRRPPSRPLSPLILPVVPQPVLSPTGPSDASPDTGGPASPLLTTAVSRGSPRGPPSPSPALLVQPLPPLHHAHAPTLSVRLGGGQGLGSRGLQPQEQKGLGWLQGACAGGYLGLSEQGAGWPWGSASPCPAGWSTRQLGRWAKSLPQARSPPRHLGPGGFGGGWEGAAGHTQTEG